MRIERCDCCQSNSISLPDNSMVVGWKVCQECRSYDDGFKDLMKKKEELPEDEYMAHAVWFFASRAPM